MERARGTKRLIDGIIFPFGSRSIYEEHLFRVIGSCDGSTVLDLSPALQRQSRKDANKDPSDIDDTSSSRGVQKKWLFAINNKVLSNVMKSVTYQENYLDLTLIGFQVALYLGRDPS